MVMNIFISSIEDGSGKTFIASGIAAVMQSLGYKSGVYKPFQIGAIDKGNYLLSPDLSFVKMVDSYIRTHSTYMFKSSAIPEVAATLDNVNINFENILNDYEQLSKLTDILFVESVGGLMTPLKNNLFSFHIPQKLNLPVLFIVTPSTSATLKVKSSQMFLKSISSGFLIYFFNRLHEINIP